MTLGRIESFVVPAWFINLLFLCNKNTKNFEFSIQYSTFPGKINRYKNKDDSNKLAKTQEKKNHK